MLMHSYPVDLEGFHAFNSKLYLNFCTDACCQLTNAKNREKKLEVPRPKYKKKLSVSLVWDWEPIPGTVTWIISPSGGSVLIFFKGRQSPDGPGK